MPASRKGMNFKEFASTLRQPPLQFENPNGDPLQTPAAKFLQQFAVGTINSIMQDLKDSDLEIEQNKYNKKPFKNYAQKVKEDEELKNPVNKLAKAALVNKANLNGGDPLASSMAAIIDSFTDNIALDSIAGLGQIPPTPLEKQAAKMAREEFLKSLGLNSLALMTSIGVSSLVSLVPIETITQFNTQEYLKYLDPVFLLEKLIGSIKNKRFQDAVNDFKLVGRFVNSVLTSSQFESKMQQVYLDMLADQEDLPEQLRNITSFDQVTALVNPETFDTNQPDTETFVNLSTVSLDLLQNGKLGIDLELVSRDVNGNVLGEVSLNSLSEDLIGLVSGAQDDLQSLFDSLESCSLPDPDMFNRYRKLGLATKAFFKGFKPFKKPKKSKIPKLSVDDRYKLLEEIPAIAAAAMFYTATSLLFKTVLSALEKLIPDLSCASISAMLPDASEIFGPRDQNTPMTPEQLAQTIKENILSKNPSAINDPDTEAISEMLAEIATSIGLVNGVDVNTLNQFMALTMSVLTQREYCELLSGSPTGEAILIVQNIIDYRFPQAGISRSPDDIIKFFSSLSTFLDPGCGRILTTVDIPVNTVFCEVPEYYQLYNDLRIKLLKEKGLQDRDIEVQINKVCDINARQAQQFLDLLNSENPLDSMIPTIETGNKNCGPDNSIGILNEIVAKELTRSYGNMFRPLKEVLDDSMVGNRGFLTSILASKNGLAYPIFDNLVGSYSEAIDKNELLESINDVPDDEKTNNEIFTKMKPKTIASWMTLNLEEFCTLPHTGRLASTPLTVMPGSFNNPDSIISEADKSDQTASEYKLTEEDKVRLIYLSNLTEDNVSTIPADQLLNYDDLFKRIGNIKFGVRALSYSGFYDPTESVIGDLSVSGIRQINISSGASTANEETKKKITSKILSTLTTALVAPTLLPTVLAENAIAISDLKKSELKKIPIIPQTEKKISSDQTGYRVKSYNFFILPTNALNQPVGTIKTQIFDYFPVNINAYQKISPLRKKNGNYIREKHELEEKNDIESNNQGVFDSNRKFYEIKTLTKTSKDYLIDLNQENVSTPTLSLALNDDDLQGSTQSLIFAEMVLKAMKDNLGIESDSIPEIRKYTDYLKKELYNYTFNSFLDGIMKIPAYNTKNLSFGLTEEKVNVLDLSHVNTITGDLDPVEDPTEYGGTFEDPSYYVYTKLNDDWKGLYNLYVRQKNDSVSPARTAIPDFDALTAESADLYQKFAEEYRTATDYSNQAPFDLIVQKASLVSMNGLLEMMMKVFVFEHYYKGFSFLNTVEITDNVFDNVYFEFLAKRFKEYAITAGPRVGVRRRKSKKFYHMLMEIYVMVLLKKKEARISSLTPTENDAVNKIIRKSNIWKFGIPKNNLTDQEALYSRAYDLIAQHEVPGYPVGVVANAIGNSEGSLVAANGLIAQAKKQREEQIKIRNTYWSSIMEDCEPLFEQLLKVKFRQEMDNVSKQLSILNPNLIKENSILYMPINGGPIVQNYEVPPSTNDNTAKMRNIYDYHPSLLYSAGDILVTDKAYGPFYSFREEGNDRNFNGFFFSNLYNQQNYYTEDVSINNEPKEPVYKLGNIDPISNTDMRNFIVNTIGPDSSNLLFGGGNVTFFNGLSATTINSIELNKRDIIVNNFLLRPSHTKAGIDSSFKSNFTVLQDSKEWSSDGPGIGSSYDPRANKRDISEQIGTDTVSAGIGVELGGGETSLNSVKRYKVISTEDSKIYPLGSDGFMVGGFSASNMPLVLSQTPAPIILEQYVYLSEIEDFFQGTQAERSNYYLPGSGIDSISSLRDSLQFALYGVILSDPTQTRTLPETFDSSSVSEPTLQGIFKGPVSLSTLIYWLGNQGFFDMSDNLLDLPLKTFFQPGTFKYGVRMLLMQPDSNLSIEGGIHAYLDSLSLDEPLRTKFEKAFSKETGYSIPIFKEEEEVNWTFRDLKTIFNSYNSQAVQGERRNKWIDHSALTRPILVRLFSKMACSTDYKKMFDFCIPLRYFASLSAIYTTKAFTNSIGSAVDWSGVKRTPQKLFPNDERNVLLSFYHSVRKVFYYSYNSFDPSYDGEGDELTNNPDIERDSELKAARAPSNPGRDGLILIDQLNKGLQEANKIGPEIYQNNEDLLSLANSMYYSVLVDDPTNACGSVKKTDSC